MKRTWSAVGCVIRFVVIGALLIQPLAALLWVVSEHGGRGLMTFPWAAMWGGITGALVGLACLGVRTLYRRISRARTA